MKPVPEKGKFYNVFDDGKITHSRLYKVYVTDIIPFLEIKEPILRLWNIQKEECDWLYAPETDYFIETRDERNNLEMFVRTLNGGWFSIGDYMGCGRMDVDGELTKLLKTK